jgi:transcription antitermination factor NusG
MPKGMLLSDYNKKTKTSPVEEVIKRVYEVHGNRVKLIKETYKNARTEALFIDEDFGEFWKEPRLVINRGTGHPKRRKYGKQVSVEVFSLRLQEKFGDAVTLVKETYKNTYERATFIDKELGLFEAIPKHLIKDGLGHPDKAKEVIRNALAYTLEEVKNKIKKVHGDEIEIVDSTFTDMKGEATFIHKKYGEWKSNPEKVIAGHGPIAGSVEKQQQTMLDRHGAKSPAQVRKFALKILRKSNKTTLKYHWKTKEELICTASYECAVVDYLNSNKINFLWQPEVFKVPVKVMVSPKNNQMYYRPDLYLTDLDIWVEIKGYFREDSKKKWDWFKAEYPTAELWDKKKLIKMGIL